MSVKNYKDYGYARAQVNDSDVKDRMIEELSLNESDMLDGLVFDGKIIPVVNIKPMLRNGTMVSKGFGAGDWETLPYPGWYSFAISAGDEFAVKQIINGSWYELVHLGGASPLFALNVFCQGCDGNFDNTDTRIRCIVAGSVDINMTVFTDCKPFGVSVPLS